MILVNLQLTIKPEVREEFIEWFYSVLPDTRAYEGCSELKHARWKEIPMQSR